MNDATEIHGAAEALERIESLILTWDNNVVVLMELAGEAEEELDEARSNYEFREGKVEAAKDVLHNLNAALKLLRQVEKAAKQLGLEENA